jgi:hypothetical protein
VPKRPADGIDPAGFRSGSIEELNEKAGDFPRVTGLLRIAAALMFPD